MRKITALFILMLAMSAAGFGQNGNARNDQSGSSQLPGNKELVSRARSVHVYSESDLMKREELESSLLGRDEFRAWNMQITARPEQADLLIRVDRKLFTNHFIYTVTDRATETIVMAGKVDSLAGTVYGLIADEIVHKMKEYRGDPMAKQEAPKSQTCRSCTGATGSFMSNKPRGNHPGNNA